MSNFLEREFNATGKVKEVKILGRERKEIAVVELRDWKSKQEVMSIKKHLRRDKIFIDHDLSRKKRSKVALKRR